MAQTNDMEWSPTSAISLHQDTEDLPQTTPPATLLASEPDTLMPDVLLESQAVNSPAPSLVNTRVNRASRARPRLNPATFIPPSIGQRAAIRSVLREIPQSSFQASLRGRERINLFDSSRPFDPHNVLNRRSGPPSKYGARSSPPLVPLTPAQRSLPNGKPPTPNWHDPFTERSRIRIFDDYKKDQDVETGRNEISMAEGSFKGYHVPGSWPEDVVSSAVETSAPAWPSIVYSVLSSCSRVQYAWQKLTATIGVCKPAITTASRISCAGAVATKRRLVEAYGQTRARMFRRHERAVRRVRNASPVIQPPAEALPPTDTSTIRGSSTITTDAPTEDLASLGAPSTTYSDTAEAAAPHEYLNTPPAIHHEITGAPLPHGLLTTSTPLETEDSLGMDEAPTPHGHLTTTIPIEDEVMLEATEVITLQGQPNTTTETEDSQSLVNPSTPISQASIHNARDDPPRSILRPRDGSVRARDSGVTFTDDLIASRHVYYVPEPALSPLELNSLDPGDASFDSNSSMDSLLARNTYLNSFPAAAMPSPARSPPSRPEAALGHRTDPDEELDSSLTSVEDLEYAATPSPQPPSSPPLPDTALGYRVDIDEEPDSPLSSVGDLDNATTPSPLPREPESDFPRVTTPTPQSLEQDSPRVTTSTPQSLEQDSPRVATPIPQSLEPDSPRVNIPTLQPPEPDATSVPTTPTGPEPNEPESFSATNEAPSPLLTALSSPASSSSDEQIEATLSPVMNVAHRRSSVRIQQNKAKYWDDLAQLQIHGEDDQGEKRRQEAERLAKIEADRRSNRRAPAEPVLTAINAEWEARLAAAMARRSTHELATTPSKTKLTRRDFGTLLPQPGTNDDPRGWLNDDIIMAGLEQVVSFALKKSGHRDGTTPKYHSYNTFFYKNLNERGPASISRWGRRAKIGGEALLNVDYVFIPVNPVGVHWTLLVVMPSRKKVEYFDSMHGSGARMLNNAKAWLKNELGPKFVEQDWTFREGISPHQTNGSDCGVFVITTAKMVMLGLDPEKAYSQRDLAIQRKRIACELIAGGYEGSFEPQDLGEPGVLAMTPVTLRT